MTMARSKEAGVTCCITGYFDGEPPAQTVEWSQPQDPTSWTPAESSDYGEQCADTDGLAILEARIARKDAANEALVQHVFALEAKLAATTADLQCIARARDEYAAEAQRLSEVARDLTAELAKRMAIPARALRYGGM